MLNEKMDDEMSQESAFDGEVIAMEILNRENPRNISLVGIANEIAANTLNMYIFRRKEDIEHQIVSHALRKRNQRLYSELDSRDWKY